MATERKRLAAEYADAVTEYFEKSGYLADAVTDHQKEAIPALKQACDQARKRCQDLRQKLSGNSGCSEGGTSTGPPIALL